MPTLSLCFRIHIPYRLSQYAPDQIGRSTAYFADQEQATMINQLADNCYLPANRLLSLLLQEQQGRFRIAFSISGCALELLRNYRPDVIDSFRELADTGLVEFTAETYYNSLSWLYSKKEFGLQTAMHSSLLEALFGKKPAVFRNTEHIYSNELATFISDMQYSGVICEGADHFIQGASGNQVYESPGGTSLLLRHMLLSDELAHPAQALTASSFARDVCTQPGSCHTTLLLDYETVIGPHAINTGSGALLQQLPAAIHAYQGWSFATPSMAISNYRSAGIYDVPETISWKDNERDSIVWSENSRQHNMLRKIYSLENMVERNADDVEKRHWRQLQSVDHFYHMGDEVLINEESNLTHPFASGTDAFKTYVNIVTDFEIRLIEKGLAKFKTDHYPHINPLY